MKIKVDVEMTPEELRRFFGLPDVEPLNQELVEIIKRKMAQGAESFDPIALWKPWLPSHLQSLESLQKSFWDAFKQQKTSENNEQE